MKTCQFCQAEFEPKAPGQKYCGINCKRRAHYKHSEQQQTFFPINCGNPKCDVIIENPTAHQKYCSRKCKESHRFQRKSQNPAPLPQAIPPEYLIPGPVRFDSVKAYWVVATGENKFYASDLEEAIKKRREWLRENKFLELVSEVDKLCKKYEYDVTEFYGLLEPIVKGGTQSDVGGDNQGT